MSKLPTPEALDSFEKLLGCAIENGYILGERYELYGHRQNWVSKTECPGDQFFAYIKQLPHYGFICQKFL